MSITSVNSLVVKVAVKVPQRTVFNFPCQKMFRNAVRLLAMMMAISSVDGASSAQAATVVVDGASSAQAATAADSHGLSFNSDTLPFDLGDRPTAPTTPELAQLPVDSDPEQFSPLSQLTSVSQLSDVQPTDWAFGALQSLIERYGCIAGYPDGTYRGNRTLTRYEFAAGLNACLQQIADAIAARETLPPQDIPVIERLQQEFAVELATLRDRVDTLEMRTATLEADRFSATTKLSGEVAVVLETALGDRRADRDRTIDENLTLSQRTRLGLNTSFTGRDRLSVRFEAANMPSLAAATGTRFVSRNYDGNSDNAVLLNQLLYNFPIGDRIMAQIGTTGDFVEVFNIASTQPFSADALSLINTYNPLIYRVYATNGGPRLGAKIRLSDSLSIDTGYFTPGTAATPVSGQGLFNGAYAAAAQLNVELGETVDLALSYLHSYQGGSDPYDLSGYTGSARAADPFFQRANSTNNLGIQANWRINSRFNIGGFVGYSHAYTEAGASANADIWTWSLNLALPDLGKEGSVLLAAFGMPPKLTESSGDDVENPDPDTGYVLDLEYRYYLSEHINLALGSYAAFNPNHNDDNEPIYVVRFRPVFRF